MQTEEQRILLAGFADVLLSEEANWEQQAVQNNGGGKRAAVLALVARDGRGQWRILLNVRSQQLRRHPGEVCLPGGMYDPHCDRTPADTALREAYEEMGLPPSFVRVLAPLRPLFTRQNVRIFPVLATMDRNRMRAFKPHYSAEVEHHFWAPLEHFLRREGHERVQVPDSDFRLHVFSVPGERDPVFGVTALICVAVAVGLLRTVPQFEEDPGTSEDFLVALFKRLGSPAPHFVAQERILQAMASKL